jgi:hypothetical protein
MTIEEKIVEILDGKYDIESIEYFDLSLEDREKIANTIVSQVLWKLKVDFSYKIFYLEFLEFRLQELLEEEKYESADLYRRIINKINLM